MANLEVVRPLVHRIVRDELGVDRDKITDDARFVDDLGADSLDIVELVMGFEEEFRITITDEDAQRITTVGEAIQYIVEHAP